MASAAALVTTAVEGVGGFARHGENAMVCPAGDPEALRRQVECLLRDPVLRQRIQEQGPGTAASFSVEESARQLLLFLREVFEAEVPTPVLECNLEVSRPPTGGP
jgi:glycosyltransferase involved in cell wall biosynthesis